MTKSDNALAAVIQMCSGNNREKNLASAGKLMKEAASRGAKLLVLPENFSFMGRNEEEKRAHREDPENSPSLNFLKEFAKEQKVWIVGGTIPMASEVEGKSFGACFLVSADGKVKSRYDKIHLFDVDLGVGDVYRESDFIQPGKTPVIAETPFGLLGLTVCYDLRFPELYRHLAAQGAIMLAVPAAFTLTTGKDHWELLLRARAVENFAYVLAADQWGRHPGGRQTYGHSMIVEPWGTVEARCADGQGVVMAPIDPVRSSRCRARIPCLKHRIL
ncbi:MAG: carbon-nitrogen hydrolase family protein [Magnetococcales bacterium]|nr:carbon-nitrogen hydrolase family protein [Magnetococcales bacterium]NGZ28141.1 carbon-nitrogen hydrolase family protein [Magnetococcales bacterium]